MQTLVQSLGQRAFLYILTAYLTVGPCGTRETVVAVIGRECKLYSLLWTIGLRNRTLNLVKAKSGLVLPSYSEEKERNGSTSQSVLY
jgi:hypothetical protein